MRALLDTDVILDLALAREPFRAAARAVWEANRQGKFEGFISPVTPVNVFYIARKVKGRDTAYRLVGEILASFHVCPLDDATLHSAFALPFTDFEDAVQHASAQTAGLDAIITRNLSDYASATLPIYSPDAFLDHLAAQDVLDS